MDTGHAIFLSRFGINPKLIMKSTKGFNTMLAQVGSRLADLRIKKGFPTIKEFTVKYGLPEIQYWRMEKGKANITLKSLVKVLSIHNINLQEFFCLIVEEKMAA
jgi:hypothetical protein